MIGELLASAVSNPGFSWICSPACTELEQVVLDWCAKMFGLGDGFLSSSGTGGGIIGVSLLCYVILLTGPKPGLQVDDRISKGNVLMEDIGISIDRLPDCCHSS